MVGVSRDRQVLRYCAGRVVELVIDAEAGAAIADVGGFDEELLGQLLLHAQRPALDVGARALVGIEGDVLAEVGGETAFGSARRQQAVGKRIGVRGDVGEAAVERA